jgi:hypothetical protein
LEGGEEALAPGVFCHFIGEGEAGLGQVLTEVAVSDDLIDRGGQAVGITFLNQEPTLPVLYQGAGSLGGDDWAACGHGLMHHTGAAFRQGG